MLGGLPPVAVSLQPADCPTEAQLQRVLAALGAKLVPFGSPARATVFAQRDASGEWTLVLGRPGHNEKRKVTLTGGCDEQASALGAIIERFARPVLIPTRDPAPSTVDAGTPDAGGATGSLDAGAPAPAPAEPPPSPSPPPIIVFETAPSDADAGVPQEAPTGTPLIERFHVGARGGVGVSGYGVSAAAGLWTELRWNRLGVGVGLDYYGPMRAQLATVAARIEQCRLYFFARLGFLTYLGLEAGVGLSAAWSQGAVQVNDEAGMYHAGLYLGLNGRVPVGPVELWAGLRGWGFIPNSDLYRADNGEVFRFPTFFGDLMAGVSVKL